MSQMKEGLKSWAGNCNKCQCLRELSKALEEALRVEIEHVSVYVKDLKASGSLGTAYPRPRISAEELKDTLDILEAEGFLLHTGSVSIHSLLWGEWNNIKYAEGLANGLQESKTELEDAEKIIEALSHAVDAAKRVSSFGFISCMTR